MNNARQIQQYLIVTLDLRNAFGEVQHNLINCVLKYHHVSEDIPEIVKNLYCCFKALYRLMALLLTSYIWKKLFYKGVV